MHNRSGYLVFAIQLYLVLAYGNGWLIFPFSPGFHAE